MKSSEPELEITGCDMEKVIFIVCFLAVTVYLTVTAWEDQKSCEVTRWKHLLGSIPAIIMYVMHIDRYDLWEYVLVLFFAVIYVAIGYMGVYGFADGILMCVLTIFFGSIGGIAGVGIVLLIMIFAAFSFLICHVAKSIINHNRIYLHMPGALIPHLFVGYIAVLCIIATNVM